MPSKLNKTIRTLKNKYFSYTNVEYLFRETTNSDKCRYDFERMERLAIISNRSNFECSELMSLIKRRLHEDHRKRVHYDKTLILLEYLLKRGSTRVVKYWIARKTQILNLINFQSNCCELIPEIVQIRALANNVLSLLEEPEFLRQQRKQCLTNVKITIESFANMTVYSCKEEEQKVEEEVDLIEWIDCPIPDLSTATDNIVTLTLLD